MLLGIDLGTTGVKAVVVDPEDARTGPSPSGYAQYPSSVGQHGEHEQDPQDWWRAAVAAVRSLLLQVPAARVSAVGLSGHMHAVSLVDAGGSPVRPAMTWADRRAAAQSEELAAHAALFSRRCANPVVPAFPVTRLRWLAQHEPHSLEAARWLVQPKDVLRHRLTGSWGTDPSDAAGTLLYDLHSHRWAEDLWALAGVDPRLAPPVSSSTQVIGGVTQDAAEATGLRPGTPVVAGAGDVAAAAFGAGVVRPGQVYLNTGTAAQVMAPTPEPSPGRGFTFLPAAGDGYLTMASVYAAGMSVQWMERDVLGLGDGSAGGLDAEAGRAAAGAGGVVYLPYLLGASAPVHDAGVRAGFLGLSSEHGRAHMARAVLEGVAFGCLDSVDEVARAAGEVRELRVGGGVARSAVWRGALAAGSPAPVRRLAVDPSPVGAALLAGLGTGVWPGPQEAAATVRTSEVEPADQGDAAALRRSRERYRAASAAVLAMASSPGWRQP